MNSKQVAVNSPAEVCGEDVEAFVPVQQRVESTAVRPVDGVALVRCPERQLAAKQEDRRCKPFDCLERKEQQGARGKGFLGY